MAQTILIDAVNNLAVYNGVVRIECSAVGPDGKPHPSITLLIPGAAASSVLNALIQGTQELEKKTREQQRAAAETASDIIRFN